MIASMLGSAGIGNNMLSAVLDARQRLLKPGGSIIPSVLRPCFCPVEIFDWYHSKIDCWNQTRLDFSFRAARDIAVNQTGACKIDKRAVLAEPQFFDEIRLSEMITANVTGSIRFSVERKGVLHALAGWVHVTMTDNVFCSNSPFDPKAMPWDQMVLPIESPIQLQPGDTITATIRADAVNNESILTWNIQVYGTFGQIKAKFQNSTFNGLLLTREDLGKHSLDAIPILSESATVERVVLNLCDGKRTVKEIAAELQRLFPRTLKNLEAAETCTIRVLYARRSPTLT